VLAVLACLLSATPSAAQNVRRLTSTIPPASGGGTTVRVIPGQSISAAITAAGVGGVVLLKAGTHRIADIGSLTPLNNQVILGERDATGTRVSRLNGSRILTNWIADSGRWYVTGQTQAGTVSTDPNDCDMGTPENPVTAGRYDRCIYPEQLYFGCNAVATCTMKHHETSLMATGAGEWFFDYAADRIYVGDDPTSAFVETAVLDHPFTGTATGVTIRGLVIEMFATRNNEGTVETEGADWLIDDNEIRWNHGAGVYVGTTSGMARARGNYIHHNCNYAIIGAGANILVDQNELAYNNILPQSTDWEDTCGFWSFWGAGATKFVHTLGLIFHKNYSHHNNGPGFWADIENRLGIVEYNRFEYNRRSGIFWEISCAAVIRYNGAINNGLGGDFPGIMTGTGIEVNTSRDVEVHGNVAVGNIGGGISGYDDGVRNGGSEAGGPCILAGFTWQLVNLNVHDNIIESCINSAGLGLTGVIDTNTGDSSNAFTTATFEGNSYILGTATNYFMWSAGEIAQAAWTAVGHDTPGGTFGSCP